MVMKMFCCLCLCFFNFHVGCDMSVDGYFQNIIYESYKINIYKEGVVNEIYKNDPLFNILNYEFCNMLIDSREMPALGIALNDEIVNELNMGLWIEFVFHDVHVHEGLEFSSLLIKVEPDSFGFNIFRKVNGEYMGRCFYIQLNEKSMGNFSKILVENL